MSGRLIIGAILLAVSVVSIAICYLGARNPREPKWADDTIMGNFIIPLAVGGIFMGPMFLGEAFLGNLDLLSTMDMIIAFGILGAGVLVIFLLRIKKRVAEYDVLRNDPAFINRPRREDNKKIIGTPDPV
ncbi:MAG: hypothetical protein KJ630_10500 [Proteobacteria bacterium]|nr:hypothetical protein [Pseudomonadota bacterium]